MLCCKRILSSSCDRISECATNFFRASGHSRHLKPRASFDIFRVSGILTYLSPANVDGYAEVTVTSTLAAGVNLVAFQLRTQTEYPPPPPPPFPCVSNEVVHPALGHIRRGHPGNRAVKNRHIEIIDLSGPI